MRHNIHDLVVFKKLTTVSRENSTFELLWHLDLEITNQKTVINVLFRNVVNGDYVIDGIAPEYLNYCSVGSFFKGGRKLETHKATGEYKHLFVNVPDHGSFKSIGQELNDTTYDLNFIRMDKDGQSNSLLAELCKKQKCMVFSQGPDKVIIPCSVIASTYFLISHSMRVQLLAQNLHGLYEVIHFDPSTEIARIIIYRNARKEDAKHIARFALSEHATKCWENVLNGLRHLSRTTKDGRNYSNLIAKIPVIQQNLDMIVRCTELPNSSGGSTTIVHEILEEWSEWPFKTLRIARRLNAPISPETNVVTELDADTNRNIVNKPPSKIYKGNWVDQFDVPDNPLLNEVEFEEEILPSRFEAAQTRTVMEKTDKKVSLSSQRARGRDRDDLVAKGLLNQKESKKEKKQRMALAEFQKMVSGFEAMDDVSGLFVSTEMTVPFRNQISRRKRFTLRESYNNRHWNRRHYLYVTFSFKGKHVCLVEFDQSGLPTRIGTHVLVGSSTFNEKHANTCALDFVEETKSDEIKNKWKKIKVSFDTKSHPPNGAEMHWGSWRDKVLEMVHW